MNDSHEKSERGLLSPSNVAAATLVGFLFAGHFTDWKMLRGRPSKSELSVSPGRSKRPSQPVAAIAAPDREANVESNPQCGSRRQRPSNP